MNLYSEQWKTLTASLGKQHSQQTGENENDVPPSNQVLRGGNGSLFLARVFCARKIALLWLEVDCTLGGGSLWVGIFSNVNAIPALE